MKAPTTDDLLQAEHEHGYERGVMDSASVANDALSWSAKPLRLKVEAAILALLDALEVKP